VSYSLEQRSKFLNNPIFHYHGVKRNITSPLAPQAPTSPSPYAEDPTISPSPTMESNDQQVTQYYVLVHVKSKELFRVFEHISIHIKRQLHSSSSYSLFLYKIEVNNHD
jgi:hypothetical protein